MDRFNGVSTYSVILLLNAEWHVDYWIINRWLPYSEWIHVPTYIKNQVWVSEYDI